MISQIISHYRILETLGRGGMGEVYLAEDTRLGRTVALKVLPANVADNQDRLHRFIQEAKAASALSHPNVCVIHEVGETDDGRPFIVMELVQGQALDAKINGRPMDVSDIVKISMQVADALDEAHAKGIIHRDIKSSNIMITPRGQVKVLDFGLAKVMVPTLQTIGSDIATRVKTEPGLLMGTISYMSPEQSLGQEVDRRTDIFSLGVVLYEMSTGVLPFTGETTAALFDALLNKAPISPGRLNPTLPVELEQIIGRALEKDRDMRYQTASDLRADLKRLKRDTESVRISSSRKARSAQRRRPGPSQRIGFSALAAGVILVLATIAYVSVLRPTLSSHPELLLTSFSGGNGLAVSPSWSPDGQWIAYASDEAGNFDLWKKPIAGGEALQLTASPHNESQPAWSPDGRTIAFSSDQDRGGIFLLPAGGGTPFRLTMFGANPTWSPDNETIAFDRHGDIYVVSYTGGVPRLIVSGTSSTPHMVWSPDGKQLIYWNRTKGDLYIVSVEDGTSRPLRLIPSAEEVSGLTLSRDGRQLVFSRGTFGGNKDLWLVALDPGRMEPIGDPVPLSVTTTDDIQCRFSPDGTKLAFTARQLERHLWALPLDPTTGFITGPTKQITQRSKQNAYPALSLDGRKLVWTSHEAGRGVLYTRELDKPGEKKVTREWARSIREVGGSFSPDGQQISYASTLGSSYELWRIPSVDSVALRLTETKHPIRDALTAWSPNGDTIVFYSNRSGNWDIWSIQATARSQPKRLTNWRSNELYPTWSPDGCQIAFRTDKDGNADIWLMGMDTLNPQPYITDAAEEAWSAWSPDGGAFYFVSDRSGVFNIWMKPAEGDHLRQVTHYQGLANGLPESPLFTKFAISSSQLIVPLESRTGEIYILENIQ